MTQLQPEALSQLKDQIKIIKNYSDEISESQGITANAISCLVVSQYAQAIANSLNQIEALIQIVLKKLPQEVPTIILPK